MSLSEFSTVMKARAALKRGRVRTELELWQDSMYAYTKTVPREKSELLEAAILSTSDTGAFRRVSASLKHNVTVVDEELLKRHFAFYNYLSPPIVDDVQTIPGSSSNGLMLGYITWYNNKYALKDKAPLEYYSNTAAVTAGAKDITGVRFKTSFVNTSENMRLFLKTCGLTDIDFEEYGQKFEIGHIESQYHIRLKATKNSGVNYNSFISKITEFHALLDIASSSLKPEYEKLTANVLKGTDSAGNMYINVQMQLKDNKDARAYSLGILDANTNQGSGALSKALGFTGILQDIASSEPEYAWQKRILRDLEKDSGLVAKKLNELYRNYVQNYATAQEALLSSLPNKQSDIIAFMLDLKSSKTLRQHAKDSLAKEVLDVLKGNVVSKPLEPFKANLSNAPIKDFKSDISKAKSLSKDISQLSSKIKQNLTKLKSSEKKAQTTKKLPVKLRTTQGRFTSLASLQTLLNLALHDQIKQNMGTGTRRDVLNYRTGRFAESVEVTHMSQSREGMLTAYYTYMKYPYQTFEPGYAQGSPRTRDPKLLISKSIREVLSTQVKNRLRAVLA